MVRCEHNAETGQDLTENEKVFTYIKHLLALKKNCLYFPDFFQVWKTTGQISRLLQEFKTLCESCL